MTRLWCFRMLSRTFLTLPQNVCCAMWLSDWPSRSLRRYHTFTCKSQHISNKHALMSLFMVLNVNHSQHIKNFSLSSEFLSGIKVHPRYQCDTSSAENCVGFRLWKHSTSLQLQWGDQQDIWEGKSAQNSRQKSNSLPMFFIRLHNCLCPHSRAVQFACFIS